jgi:LuxR family maltose regulon positive regulatory protein
MQIITNKIAVPEQKPHLSRPRLLRTLHQGMDSQAATLLSGRAGTGKTLIAAEFARTCERRVAWFKVDGSDDDHEVFFRYLFAALRTNWPRFCERWEKVFRITATASDMELFAEFVVIELQEYSAEPLLIVLDDLHLVYDADWLTPFFTRLIPLLPRNVHLLISGRSLPPAPLWRLRSKQMLGVVDESELAFTADEARELFGHSGVGESVACALKESRGRASLLDELASGSSRYFSPAADPIRLTT